MTWIPVLLLHEMLLWTISCGNVDIGEVCANALPSDSGHADMMKSFCASHNLDMASCIPIGLHGDGVPFSKGQSAEVLSWDFAALPSAARIFFSVVEKKVSRFR